MREATAIVCKPKLRVGVSQGVSEHNLQNWRGKRAKDIFTVQILSEKFDESTSRRDNSK